MALTPLFLAVFFLAPVAGKPPPGAPEGMVLIPAGTFRPFYKDAAGSATAGVPVRTFLLDARPVTRSEFQTFVAEHAQWRKSRVKPLFAESNYLRDWRDDLDPGPRGPEYPAVFVSWFSARAYCQSRGKRLPSLAEWELAAADADLLPGEAGNPAEAGAWGELRLAMGGGQAAATGAAFGQVWEWTSDFNSPTAAGRSGGDADADVPLFCGAGARAVDARNYGAFLRYSFRSSLKADFALKNLGFRCASEAP